MVFREIEVFPDIDPSHKIPVADEEHELWEFDFSSIPGLPQIEDDRVGTEISISMLILCKQLSMWF